MDILWYSIPMPFKNKKDLYASQQRYRDRNHEAMWNYLLDKCCVDCDINDSRVLEFDHLPQYQKSFNISRALAGSTRSWKSILEEINKCDIVCANCHRIRTQIRGNYKRYKSHLAE